MAPTTVRPAMKPVWAASTGRRPIAHAGRFGPKTGHPPRNGQSEQVMAVESMLASYPTVRFDHFAKIRALLRTLSRSILSFPLCRNSVVAEARGVTDL